MGAVNYGYLFLPPFQKGGCCAFRRVSVPTLLSSRFRPRTRVLPIPLGGWQLILEKASYAPVVGPDRTWLTSALADNWYLTEVRPSRSSRAGQASQPRAWIAELLRRSKPARVPYWANGSNPPARRRATWEDQPVIPGHIWELIKSGHPDCLRSPSPPCKNI